MEIVSKLELESKKFFFGKFAGKFGKTRKMENFLMGKYFTCKLQQLFKRHQMCQTNNKKVVG